MKLLMLTTAAFLATSWTLFAQKEVYPLSGSGASGQYNTVMDPAMGDGSLGNQTKVLPADNIYVGQAGEGGSAYLLAFDTNKELWDAASQGKLTLELPLIGKTGSGAKVTVLLLGGSKPLEAKKWARFGAWNVASGYTVLGEISGEENAQPFTFKVDWAGKGIWDQNPVAWFAVFVQEKDFKGNDDKMIFAGEGASMPKLVIAE